jgi:hypothetical protein
MGQDVAAALVVTLALAFLVWKFAFARRRRAEVPPARARPDVSVERLRRSGRSQHARARR